MNAQIAEKLVELDYSPEQTLPFLFWCVAIVKQKHKFYLCTALLAYVRGKLYNPW